MLASIEYAKPLQIETELSLLLERLYGMRSYLEIGARYGGSFERIMKALGVGSRGVAVDFPGGNFGDQESAPILMAAVARLRDRGIHADVIWGPSQAPEVIERVKAFAPFDAVMIDADHAYDAVLKDFNVYRQFATKCVIVHDIAAPDDLRSKTGKAVEVPRLWRDLQDGYFGQRFEEIIADGSNMGFGVVWL